MKLPKLRELREAARAVIKGPVTLPFPGAPSVPAETYRGRMKWDDAVCVGCGACARVCPTGAIEVTDRTEADPPGRSLVRRYGMCIYCGQCHVLCTTLTGCDHTREYDQACRSRDDSTERVEKELVLCEVCGDPVATREHLRWIYDRLGPLAYTNPTIFLAARTEDDPAPPRLEREPARADRMRILCPRCRRDLVLADRP